MTVYCSECGAEIEDGMDFCSACGALRERAFAVDDSGNMTPVDENATRVCPKCGFSFPYKDRKCPECGFEPESPQALRRPKKLGTRDWIAIAVGVVGGALGLCGLGHILIGRYSRGLMYIVLSGIFLYVSVASGQYTGNYSNSGLFMIRMLAFLVFFHSAMDLFQSVYYPPNPPSGPKEDE